MPHVLVVDDDPVVADLVAFRLRRLGLEVTVESDGESGLAAARRLRPDLVVLDWLMPRMDGLEVCRALRADADPALARTPVLLLTATLTLVLGPDGPPSWAGIAAAAAAAVVLPLGWYAARRARGRPVAMFRAVIVVALIDVLLLILSGRVV